MTGRLIDRDPASRLLDLAVGLLPGQRADWSAAMQAELASIDEPAARRRFALGCVRAIASRPSVCALLVGRVLTLSAFAVAAGFATSAAPAVQGEVLAVLIVLGALCWTGQRATPFGPVGESGWARGCRTVGVLLVGALLACVLQPGHGGGPHDGGGWWLAGLAVAAYCAIVLFVTARDHATAATLRLVALLGAGGLALWWLPTLLSAGLRSDGRWSALIVLGVVPLALVLRRRPGAPDQGVCAAIGAAASCGVLIFLAAGATFAAAPSLAPPVGNPDCCVSPPLTDSQRREQSAAEALDPYVAGLLLGALSVVLLPLAARSRPLRLK